MVAAIVKARRCEWSSGLVVLMWYLLPTLKNPRQVRQWINALTEKPCREAYNFVVLVGPTATHAENPSASTAKTLQYSRTR
jgi:hypothetical protein